MFLKCDRCDGIMAPEELWTDQGKIEISRCFFCGNVVDPVVMENRDRLEASLALMLETEAHEEREALREIGAISFSPAPRRRAA